MECLGLAELERVFHGVDLTPSVRSHIESCPSCRPRFEEISENEKVASLVRRAARVAQRDPDGTTRPVPESVVPGYEVIRPVERGGQGVVFEAIQLSTRRRVALKTLRWGALASEAERRRFEREVELASALRHPNIVTIYASGVTSCGQLYYAMEFVEGTRLDEHVADLRVGATGVREVCRLFVTICGAVEHAHRRGSIHRDLKPGNILIDGNGDPRVVDFGLAKTLVGDEVPETLTGQFVGTLRYASPEQVRGEISEIDTRTDVYSLGVVLFEALTGELPYPTLGSLEAQLQAFRELEPTRASRVRPDIDRDLDTILLRALESDPARRYGSVAALREDLEAYLEGRPVSARRASTWYVLGKVARRHRVALGVVVLLVAILTVFSTTVTMLAVDLATERNVARAAETDARESGRRATDAYEQSLVDRDLADEARRLAEETAADVSLSAAARALDAFDEDRARHLLGLVPVELRGWEWLCLAGRIRTSEETLFGHVDGIKDIAWTPDGGVVSVSRNGVVGIWGPPPGRQFESIVTSVCHANAVAVARSGEVAAIAACEGTVLLIDLIGRREVARWELDIDEVEDIVFDRECRKIIATGKAGLVVLDAATGALLVKEDLFDAQCVASNPIADEIVCGREDGLLWRMSPNAVPFVPPGLCFFFQYVDLTAHEGRRMRLRARVRCGPGRPGDGVGLFLLVGSAGPPGYSFGWESTVSHREWTEVETTSYLVGDEKAGKPAVVSVGVARELTVWVDDIALVAADGGPPLPELANATFDMELDPSSDWVVGIDGYVAEVVDDPDDPTNRCLRLRPKSVADAWHDDEITGVAWLPDGSGFVSGSSDGQVRLWSSDREQPEHEWRAGSEVRALDVDAEGRWIAVSGDSGIVRLYDLHSKRQVWAFHHGGTVSTVAFDPEGRWLATAGPDALVRLWSLPDSDEQLLQRKGPLVLGRLSPSQRMIYSAGEEELTPILLDLDTRQSRALDPGGSFLAERVRWGRSSARLFAFGRDYSSPAMDVIQQLKVWSAVGSVAPRVEVPLALEGPPTAFALDPLTGRVACATTQYEIQFVDADGDQYTAGVHRPTRWPVFSLAFTPEGDLLEGYIHGFVAVVEADSGVEKHRFQAHAGEVLGMKLSRSGRYLGTVGDTGIYPEIEWRLWELPEWRVVDLPERVVSGETPGGPLRLAFGPGGRIVYNGPTGHDIRVADLARETVMTLMGPGHRRVVDLGFGGDHEDILTVLYEDWTVEVFDPSAGRLFEPREEKARQAEEIVKELFNETVAVEKVRRRLLESHGLDEEALAHAFRVAMESVPDPHSLYVESLKTTTNAGGDKEAYSWALQQAEDLLDQAATNEFDHALGAALYRVGRFEDAERRLRRSAKKTGGNLGLDAVFLAMARYQLGDSDEAAAILDEVREGVAEGRYLFDPDTLERMIDEATQLLSSELRKMTPP